MALPRKSILGSPYSVKDYYAVKPEFGSGETVTIAEDEAIELPAWGWHLLSAK